MLPSPLVSVIIPVYNAALFLNETIQSVLAQSFTDFECILIDDASEDGSAKIIHHWASQDERIKPLFCKENLGVSSARNTGIAVAKGKYIALLDADDLWLPEKLAQQVEILNTQPDIGIVTTFSNLVDTQGKVICRECGEKVGNGHIPLQQFLFDRVSLTPSAVMFRAECVEKAGLFNTDYVIAEDFAFWIHLLRYYAMHTIPKVLLYYRIHHHNSTTNKLRNREQKILVLEQEVLNNPILCEEVTPRLQIDLQRRYLSMAKRYRKKGDIQASINTFKKALFLPHGRLGHRIECLIWLTLTYTLIR